MNFFFRLLFILINVNILILHKSKTSNEDIILILNFKPSQELKLTLDFVDQVRQNWNQIVENIRVLMEIRSHS